MTVYRLSEFPNARPDEHIHVQWPRSTRAACGAGYNWPTDTAFTDDVDEITCPDCLRFGGVPATADTVSMEPSRRGKPRGYAAGMARVAEVLTAAAAADPSIGMTRADIAAAAQLSEARTVDILAHLLSQRAIGYYGRPRRHRLADPDKLAALVAEAAARP